MSKTPWLILTAAFFASPAAAHVYLEGKQATVGSSYKAVFAVPHGCSGSSTVKLRVQIPEGVIAVKPMPKAGWNVDVVEGAYASAYDYHGNKLTSGVKEVVWSGGETLVYQSRQSSPSAAASRSAASCFASSGSSVACSPLSVTGSMKAMMRL